MPIVAQGATLNPPFSLDVRNGTGDFVDPTNLSLTFKDSLGAALPGFPVTYPGTIVKDAVGRYHYPYTVSISQTIGTYTAEWDAILLGSPTSAQETYEIVGAGSMTTPGLDFLLVPDDYEAVRNLLGVTTLDVENSDIDSPAFGPQAELDVKRRVSNWATQAVDDDMLFVLRLATIYRTACLMAESYVHGGTIGFARPLAVGEGRNWAAAAETFCAKYNYWLNVADASDDDTSDTSDFDINPMRVSGPTAVRIARTRQITGSSSHLPFPFGYPPFWSD